ncbi:MAG: response regulator [Acidobacteriota bacterium]|nr:response regulator [Acidobacteriota bacterium]
MSYQLNTMRLPVHKLLVVDDEESICFSMSEYFSMHGYQVDCAQTREEAESLLGGDNYTAVIKDIRLGGMNDTEGLDIIEHIHRHYPNTRIIVLTAFGSSEMEAEARTRGADVFLRKPKPLSDVAQVIFGLIGTAEYRAC